MLPIEQPYGVLELQWDQDGRGDTLYGLYSRLDSGQLRMESTFHQGPFDTALEVAQWLTRTVARLVPPASP